MTDTATVPASTGTSVALTSADLDQFARLVAATFDAAVGDSNDTEIEALQEVRDFAVSVLGVTDGQIAVFRTVDDLGDPIG